MSTPNQMNDLFNDAIDAFNLLQEQLALLNNATGYYPAIASINDAIVSQKQQLETVMKTFNIVTSDSEMTITSADTEEEAIEEYSELETIEIDLESIVDREAE